MAQDKFNIEQIKSFLTNVGVTDEDFIALSTNTIEDFDPYLNKIKAGVKDVLVNDTAFIEELSKPFKDAPIGKEKQLKKEARKFFNLTIKEDELSKLSLSDILKIGTDTLRVADNDGAERLKTAYSDLLEEYENFKNEVLPNKLLEVENTYKNKLQEKDLFEELMGVVAKDTQVQKENLNLYTTTFKGYVGQMGWHVEMDAKRILKLKGVDGLPVKKEDGSILTLQDALKDFSVRMQVNVKPIQQQQATTIKPNNTINLSELMGAGF